MKSTPQSVAAERTPPTSTPPSAHQPVTYQDLPMLVPVPLVAELTGLPKSSLYRYAETRELPSKRLGRRVYLIKTGLVDLLNHVEAQA